MAYTAKQRSLAVARGRARCSSALEPDDNAWRKQVVKDTNPHRDRLRVWELALLSGIDEKRTSQPLLRMLRLIGHPCKSTASKPGHIQPLEWATICQLLQ